MKISLAMRGSLGVPSQGRTGAARSDNWFGIIFGGAVIPGRLANPESRGFGFALRAPRNDSRGDHVAIGSGMLRKAWVTCQNSFRLVASATEWAVPGRMMN